MTYRVMLCCNDDRGNITDRVCAVDIGDREIALEGPNRKLGLGKNRTKIGRRWFASRGWHTWVGNIMWDATSMSLETARELVSYLLANGWSVTEYAEDGPFADIASHSR